MAENTARAADSYAEGKPWSRPIWDVTAVGWLLGGMMQDEEIPRHVPTCNYRYEIRPDLPPMRYVRHIDRDKLMGSLFGKLTN